MKYSLYVLSILVVCGGSAVAQEASTHITQPVTPLTTLAVSADEKELAEARSLLQTTNLWERSLDWKETSSSTADVVAHIKKTLSSDAPIIEMRGKDESRTTFVLPQANLGSVLCSLAELTSRRVWVFPGRLVIADENDLTNQERTSIKNRSAGEWKPEYKWSADHYFEQVAVRITVADMKQKLAAKGQSGPLIGPPISYDPGKPLVQFASYSLPFGQLTPNSQKAIQELVNTHYRAAFPNIIQPPTVAPDVLLCLDDRQSGDGLMFFKETEGVKPQFKYLGWNVPKPERAEALH